MHHSPFSNPQQKRLEIYRKGRFGPETRLEKPRRSEFHRDEDQQTQRWEFDKSRVILTGVDQSAHPMRAARQEGRMACQKCSIGYVGTALLASGRRKSSNEAK
ncbi:hypothetical protein CVT26_007325 [Gymnopilus dilepis]|uniref:Uncharacterized protein n=1 Tax=Gymnopilus dilepis TaxID=231916 RepID=A0A409W1J3_9AGAR|nr:hypothetical protein CVT26_007325 [Gymnopilus dilepis]